MGRKQGQVRHLLQGCSSSCKEVAEAPSLGNWTQRLMHPVTGPDLCLNVTKEEEKSNLTQPMSESMEPQPAPAEVPGPKALQWSCWHSITAWAVRPLGITFTQHPQGSLMFSMLFLYWFCLGKVTKSVHPIYTEPLTFS